MQLAIAILAKQNLGFALYAEQLNGASVGEIAKNNNLTPHYVEERLRAVQMSLQQVNLSVNAQFFARPL